MSFWSQRYWVIVLLVLGGIALFAILVWAIRKCQKKARYEYSALEEEALLQDRMELDRKLQKDTQRNMAMINCQYYLRGSSRYVLSSQLNDIGSRIDRYWFFVRDTATKTDRLLTMTPVCRTCPIKNSGSVQRVLLELFLTLQHPYVYPVLDFDFKCLSDQLYAIVVMPFSEKGSLKDLIYHSNCQDDQQDKYRYHGEALPVSQVQRLGKQILEGLLVLQDKGFPPFGHLHTGNVIIQNGVARITGLENPLLGHTPKIMSIAHKKLRDSREGIDALCFGHLLFEMCAGYELTRAHPSEKNLCDVAHIPQVLEVIRFIFEQDKYPTIQEISCLDFFRHIDLRELQSHATMPVFQSKLSPAAKSLLRDIRKQSRFKKPGSNRRSQSTSAIETSSISSKDSLDNSVYKSARSEKHRSLSNSQTTMALSELCLPSPQILEESQDSYHTPLRPRSQRSQVQVQQQQDTAGGSSMTVASLSNTSGSTEYYTPPDTPLPSSSRHMDHNAQLMNEIRESWKRRKLDYDAPDC